MASRIYHKLMKAIKAAKEELGDELHRDEHEHLNHTVEDEKKLMTLILDCFGLLILMQLKAKQKQQVESETNERVLYMQIFKATLSSLEECFLQSSCTPIANEHPFPDFQEIALPGTTDISMQLMQSFRCYRPVDHIKSSNMSFLHIACRYGTPTVKLLQYLLQLDASQVLISGGNNNPVIRTRNTPLGHLCYKMMEKSDDDDLPFVDLMNCLLLPGKSAQQCLDAVTECLVHPHVHKQNHYRRSKIPLDPVDEKHRSSFLWIIEAVLKACPKNDQGTGDLLTKVVGNVMNRADTDLFIDVMKLVLSHDSDAAKRVDNRKVLHYAIVRRPVGVIKFLLDHYKDAVKEADQYDRLPVFIAAQESSFEVMKLLLELFPEGANVIPSPDWQKNLLQAAITNREKVEYLSSKYPAMLERRDNRGYLPIHSAAEGDSFDWNIMRIICEAGGIEQLKMPIVDPTDTTNYRNGYLPLHLLLHDNSDYFEGKESDTERAGRDDALRYFLRMYPEAAGIVAGAGKSPATRPMNAYQMALTWCKGISEQYLRLILRAAPHLDPAALHRYNYEQRRMALFVACRARFRKGKKKPLLAQLRLENHDLFRYVVSFL